MNEPKQPAGNSWIRVYHEAKLSRAEANLARTKYLIDQLQQECKTPPRLTTSEPHEQLYQVNTYEGRTLFFPGGSIDQATDRAKDKLKQLYPNDRILCVRLYKMPELPPAPTPTANHSWRGLCFLGWAMAIALGISQWIIQATPCATPAGEVRR